MRLRRPKFKFWIFSAGKRGYSLAFSKLQILLLVFCVVLSPMLLGSIGAYAVYAFYGNPSQQAIVNESSANYGELLRLKKYQAQLEKQSASLDALVNDLALMEFDFASDGFDADQALEKAGKSSGDKKSNLAIGGGDSPRAPVISRRPKNDDNKKIAPVDSEDQTSQLLNRLNQQLEKLSTLPMGAPIQGKLSSGFGHRTFELGGSGFHLGVDFAADRLSPVLSTADGLVVDAGPKGAYGNSVLIKHANGVETLYAHLSTVSVQAGTRVCRGQRIGLSGNTGRSTGPHLHYEIRVQGIAKNPVKFIELASLLRKISEEEI